MQAILQGKHNRFCAWLKENKSNPVVNTEDINALENELLILYDRYKMRMDDLKAVIESYEKTEKTIRAKLKKNRRVFKERKGMMSQKKLHSQDYKVNI